MHVSFVRNTDNLIVLSEMSMILLKIIHMFYIINFGDLIAYLNSVKRKHLVLKVG